MWPTVLVFSWWVNKHYGHVIRYMLYYIYIFFFSFPNCCEKFSPETRSPSFGKLAPLQEEVPNLVPNPPHFRVNHVSSGGGLQGQIRRFLPNSAMIAAWNFCRCSWFFFQVLVFVHACYPGSLATRLVSFFCVFFWGVRLNFQVGFWHAFLLGKQTIPNFIQGCTKKTIHPQNWWE